MTSLFTPPKFDGRLAGSKLTFTITGTTTPQNTYTDEALTVASSNPVVADANGLFAPIYLDPRLPSYRVKYTTSANVLIYQVDGYPSNQNTSGAFRVEAIAPTLLFYDTDGTANQRKMLLRLGIDGLEFQQLNDAETVETLIDKIYWTLPSSVGSFTGVITGCTTSPSGTFSYRVTRSIVTLWTDANVQGTSNTTALTLTNLPAAIRPATQKVVPCSQLTDNTIAVNGTAAVGTGGSIIFGVHSVSGTKIVDGLFVNSGTKGIGTGWAITYPLS